MQFQIEKIILWPKKQLPPRLIHFKTGQVNIISGASKTGKSAVIPIIDYCLCANKCAIPVGIIREECSWFGVLVTTAEGEKLFARREPGNQKQTGDMFVLEDELVEIPDESPVKNATSSQVKGILDRLSGLSTLGINPDSEGYEGNRAGFRDLMAFTFQPQNIVANPDVLFFKADTTEHREKLKAIFPYVLNAISQQTMADRWELGRLSTLLHRKESALKTIESSVQIWVSEATAWIRQAKELGLIKISVDVPTIWHEIIDLLDEISSSNYRGAQTSLPAIEGVLKELLLLQKSESEEATNLSIHRQRLLEIRRLIESSKSYGDAMHIQRDRLSISEWIKSLPSNDQEPLVNVGPDGKKQLDKLCSALNGLELEIRSQTSISDKLDKEQYRLRGSAEESITRLNSIRTQIRELERKSEEVRYELYRADQIERYLGRLEQALKLYRKSGEDADLKAEVAELNQQIADIKERISEGLIQSRIRNAVSVVEGIAGQIIPTLDAEWPDAAIKFLIKDLTLKVVQENREDYLWEIGSGANWLAYHVSIALAFQRFFLQSSAHPVPNFLVFDQPSQVYFPQSPNEKDDGQEDNWQDEDIKAVRQVFDAVSNETLKAEGNLQIIVLDHADTKVWGSVQNKHLVEEWRDGTKLIPDVWSGTPPDNPSNISVTEFQEDPE